MNGTFIFYQDYLFWQNGIKAYLFSCDDVLNGKFKYLNILKVEIIPLT